MTHEPATPFANDTKGLEGKSPRTPAPPNSGTETARDLILANLPENMTGWARRDTAERILKALKVPADSQGPLTLPSSPLTFADIQQQVDALIKAAPADGLKIADWISARTKAVTPPLLGEGLVVVPREPTEEMIEAGEKLFPCAIPTPRAVFKAMLAAAPATAPSPLREEMACPKCDGAGDIHSADGEWRGECDCAPPSIGEIEEPDVLRWMRRTGRTSISLVENVDEHIALLASKPLPPTDDVRARALSAAAEAFRENMDVASNHMGGLSPNDPDYQAADTEIERNRVLAEMCEAARSAQSPPPADDGTLGIEVGNEAARRSGRRLNDWVGKALDTAAAPSPPLTDAALRLWDAIRSEAPNGEMAGVQVHPNGDWDVIKPARVAYVGDGARQSPPLADDERAYLEARNLAESLWRQHYRDGAPNWKPLPDLRGVISQIDNMVAGMVKSPPLNRGEGRLLLMLEILAASGGEANATEGPWNWLNAFCEEHEGRDPDTFNRAIELGYIRCTHDSDTDSGTVYLTDKGRQALATPSLPEGMRNED